MNKKGFTLVELIGVIVILGVLSLIAVPTVLSSIQNSKAKAYDVSIKNIKMALQSWKNSNYQLLPIEGETIYLTIFQLKQEGYLDNNFSNPVTEEEWSNDMELTISNNNGYQYNVLENTGSTTPKYNNILPTINIEGGDVVILNVGDSYKKPNVIIKDVDGTTTNDVITSSLFQDDIVTFTEKGVYQIKYTKTINNIPLEVIQNIIVRD